MTEANADQNTMRCAAPNHPGFPRPVPHDEGRTACLIAMLAVLLLAAVATAAPHEQRHELLTRRIMITAEPTTLSVADTLRLTVRDRAISRVADAVVADPMMLDWSAFRAALESALPSELVLVEGPSPLARDPSGRVFEIEPLTPGSFTIPTIELALTIDPTKLPGYDADAARDQNLMGLFSNAAAELEQQSIAAELRGSTEPITITVVSAFAEGEAPSLAGLRGIAEPRWPFPWKVIAVAGGTLAAAAVAAFFIIASCLRRRETRIVTIAADALAQRELDGVLALGDLEAGRYRVLLERVSAVLRGYLEDRFTLRAPELTTAEFLREAEANALARGAMGAADRAALGAFLTRVDMVKYAGTQATRADAEGAIDAVRSFIERTADPEATLVVQRGRTKIERPGAAARLLRSLEGGSTTAGGGARA